MTSEDMKVTAKLHGSLLGLHQDITPAESVAFLWYLRHVSVLSARTPLTRSVTGGKVQNSVPDDSALT